MKNKSTPDIVYSGIDIGQNLFHIVGLNSSSKPVFRARMTRERLIDFFSRSSSMTAGMEACPGSNWLSRKAKAYRPLARIVPAQFVKPFVKSNKIDIVDAEAITEAISRPMMRFVAPKTEAQLDLQVLHRIRQRLVSHKTSVINQARAFLLEYSIATGTGATYFVRDVPDKLTDENNELTPEMRTMLNELWIEYKAIEERLLLLRKRIEQHASADDTATRLTSIPGIGNLTATAITAFAGNGNQFSQKSSSNKWANTRYCHQHFVFGPLLTQSREAVFCRKNGSLSECIFSSNECNNWRSSGEINCSASSIISGSRCCKI